MEKIVLPFTCANCAYAAALIKETEGGEEEFPSRTEIEGESTEGNGLLAEIKLATGSSGELLVPGQAELGTEGRSCQK